MIVSSAVGVLQLTTLLVAYPIQRNGHYYEDGVKEVLCRCVTSAQSELW